ncbi:MULTISPECIES: cytochrome C [Ramlibacter]|uniref:Cytochrome C n=1 Tax=Ramlibacter aquaticus TaxID=2780094 RepID=A0ABR9SDU2_9BURK|nr:MULTISPECIES: cytochrome C [Ramlibacter]MBE7940460.1 cytochrome C [Ramlibacter aquaticus]
MRRSSPLFLAGLLALVSAVQAQPDAPSRGQLLYDTRCIQCHSAQVHWRDRHLARDWPSLRQWVDRWQSQVGQQWSQEDVDEVTRHLNDSVYHFTPPARQG